MSKPADNNELIRLEGADIAAHADSPGTTLTGIDWTLRRGEFHVVGGLNWSGKTDWLSTVGGLQRPSGGKQYLFGVDIDGTTRGELTALRRQIGFVFEQDGRLFTDLNVAENLALPLSYHRNCPVDDVLLDVQRILSACDLAAQARTAISHLSLALQRRVALARALVMEPEVLLVDTPLGNSDPVHARWWIDFLGRLHQREVDTLTAPAAIVVTVEDFRAWLAPDRRFALLDRGRFQPLGDETRLTASPEPTAREMLTSRA